jgi:hypothetical protein
MRWLNRLSIYDFEIIYRKGCNNQNADGLSRLPIDEDENENYIPEDEIVINLIQEIQTSEDIIINVIQHEIASEMNEEQTKDHNLVWIYTLKKEAHFKNQINIGLKETDFENKFQKSLYRQ